MLYGAGNLVIIWSLCDDNDIVAGITLNITQSRVLFQPKVSIHRQSVSQIGDHNRLSFNLISVR